MPPKRRGKKAAASKRLRSRKEKDPLFQEKKLKLDPFLAQFDQNVENECSIMKSDMVSTCSGIQVLYDMALLNIPTMYHKMTKAQYEEKMKNKNSEISKIADDGISKLFDLPSVMSRFESCLASTAKKKKVKKFASVSKTKKWFRGNENISDASSTSNASTSGIRTRRALAQMQGNMTPVNFVPAAKKIALFNTPAVVTPKFDPRKPLISSLLRKPKAGEIVMSMSGSPLQIPIVDTSAKPGIMVSFGGGRVVNVSDASCLSGIEMSLDQSTKRTLKLVNEKLSKVLAS